MRMVEQIAAMLASILTQREAGYVDKARREMDAQSLKSIGLTIDKLKKLSPQAMAQLLDESPAMRPVRAITLAELLLVDAELTDEQGNASESLASRVHACCLMADSIQALGSEDQAIYKAKLKATAEKLGELRTHPYIGERLRLFEL